MRRAGSAVYVHVVWGTWDRLPLLTNDLARRVYRAIGAKCEELGVLVFMHPLGTRELEIFEEIMTLGKRSFSRFNDFQHNVARGKEHNWRCRSGSRYLYICENGLVHWCSQQRGYPGIALDQYTPEMRHREYFTDKFCGPRCTVSCVQQVGILDNWRDPQPLKPMPMASPAAQPELVQIGSARSDS